MSKAKILKIPARGERAFIEVDSDAENRIPLEAMQSMIGGWIERRPLRGNGLDGLDLIINEEGKLKSLSYNPAATILSEILFRGDCIVGDAFVCGNDDELFSVGLTDEQELALRRRLQELGI